MIVNLRNKWIHVDIIVAHAPHSWDNKHQEGAEEQTFVFWEQLGVALTKRAKPHAPLFFLGDANIELSLAQTCYEGIGQHQLAKEGTHYEGMFFLCFF